MEGTEYRVTYFSDGFFGYGESGDFKQWTLMHFAPIAIAIIAIVLIGIFRNKLKNWKYEKDFRFIFAFVMIICEMSYFWRLIYVGPVSTYVEKSMMTRLPLQICQWTLIATTFMMMRKSKLLFSMCFFLTMSVGLLPMLMPAVITNTGPSYYRYYQYWCEHLLPVVGVYYMLFVHDFEPKWTGIPAALAMLILIAIPAIYCNSIIPEADYLYLKHDQYPMLSFLPDSPYLTLAIYCAIIIPLFAADLLIYRLVTKKKHAKAA